ncbi:MAG: nuclear transport factor 2 family protein [Chloroflexi bacterium]|nr:nuclear transport factor 2 family protein [Chloroflexota bacterium]
MSEARPREIFERWVAAIGRLDFDALRELLHPDYVQDFPQSGERMRGFEAFREMVEHYPGGGISEGLEPDSAALIGDEAQWAITPGYTVVPLASGGAYTAFNRTRYPDGSSWYIINVFRLRDGRIWRATTYFAPEFPAPEWRAHLVERITRLEPFPPAT